MTILFADVTEEEIEKFRPLLDRSVEDVKQELQSLAKNYYESIIVGDVESFNLTVVKLNKYLEFDVTDINEYLNYCLVMASNEILKKICNVESIYVPNYVDLRFRTHYTRENEICIKQLGLSESEIKLLTQYIKEKHDISCLMYAIDNTLVHRLKPKTLISPNLKSTIMIRTNYIRGEEIKKSGELFFALDKAFDVYNKKQERQQ